MSTVKSFEQSGKPVVGKDKRTEGTQTYAQGPTENVNLRGWLVRDVNEATYQSIVPRYNILK